MIAVRWTAATALGFALAGLIPRCGTGELLLFGAVGAIPQALALRAERRNAVIWWFNTAVAVPVAFVFAILATVAFAGMAGPPSHLRDLVSLAVGSIVAGFVVGAFQAIAFSWRAGVRTSLRWSAASAIAGPLAGAFLLGGLYGLFGDCDRGFPQPALGLVLGAPYGAITGAVLERCLRGTSKGGLDASRT